MALGRLTGRRRHALQRDPVLNMPHRILKSARATRDDPGSFSVALV